MLNLVLDFGIVKQALAPPSDPLIGPDAEEYRNAIGDSMPGRNLYSGILAQLSEPLRRKIFARYSEPSTALFWRLIRNYPGRYAASIARTTLLFAGVKGAQDENEIFRERMLSATQTGSKISLAPEAMYSKNKDFLAQRTDASAVQALLRFCEAIYDPAVVIGAALTVIGVLMSLVIRDFKAFVVATPIVYLVPYVVALSSVDRYAFPSHPFFLTAPIIVFTAFLRWLNLRRAPESRRPKGGRIGEEAIVQ